MIKLKTECDKCDHSDVCRYKNNARAAMNKLKGTEYETDISNSTWTWEDVMSREHVDIEFSCPDFKQKQQSLLREKM